MRWREFLAPCVALAVIAALAGGCSGRGAEAEAVAATEGDTQGIAAEFARPVPILPKGERSFADASLLLNGDFEDAAESGFTGWEMVSGGPLSPSTEAVSGTASARATVEDGTLLVARQPVRASSGGRYWLRGHIRAEEFSGKAYIVIQAPQGERIFSRETNAIAESTWWQPVSVEFEALVDDLRVELRAEGAGKVWFDAVELYRVKALPAENLLQNANFEDSVVASQWQVQEGFSVSASPDALVGENSLEIAAANNKTVGLYQRINVVPGATYLLDGFAKCENLEGNMRFEVQDGQRGWRAFQVYNDGLTGTQDWAYIHLEFTVPSTMNVAQVLLRRYAPKDATDAPARMWYDGVRLIKVEGH